MNGVLPSTNIDNFQKEKLVMEYAREITDENNRKMFEHNIQQLESIEPGELLSSTAEGYLHIDNRNLLTQTFFGKATLNPKWVTHTIRNIFGLFLLQSEFQEQSKYDLLELSARIEVLIPKIFENLDHLITTYNNREKYEIKNAIIQTKDEYGTLIYDQLSKNAKLNVKRYSRLSEECREKENKKRTKYIHWLENLLLLKKDQIMTI